MRYQQFKLNDSLLHYSYVTTLQDLRQVEDALMGSTQGVFGLDTETMKTTDNVKAGLDPHQSAIRLVQIQNGHTIYVIDCQSIKVRELKDILEKYEYVAHNAVFEIKHFRHVGINIKCDCSMLVGMLVDRAEHSPFEPDEVEEQELEEEPDGNARYRKRGGLSLENLCARYLNITVAKEMQLSDWSQVVLTKEQLLYAALDAYLTHKLFTTLYARILSYKMVRVYSLLKEMQHVIADMELAGMRINREGHAALIETWQKEEDRARNACAPFFEGINLQSSQQLNKWLVANFKKSILEAWPKTKKGKYSFSRIELTLFSHLEPIRALLEYKKVTKLLQTYGVSLQDKISPITNRIHCSFFLGETRTGRLSCRDPNLQNMPRDGSMRAIFEAAEGNLLVISDFSQIEMRVAGELSGDPTMLKAFREEVDLHKAIVAAITGKSIDAISKKERQMGKAVNFGLLFGMGAKKLAKYAKMSYDVDMSEDEAQAAWEVFHYKRYPVYSAWCNVVRDGARRIGYIRTPSGKMRKLLEEEVYTKAINTPVQGGAAEVAFASMVLIRNRLQDTPIRIINTVHDEIILECPKGFEQRALEVLETGMRDGMRMIFPNATVNGLVESRIVKTWAKG